MILTYAVPCHSRLADLQLSLPSVFAAAALSPPVEVLVIDYAAPVPLATSLRVHTPGSDDGNTFRIVRYTGRDHFHCSHARNIGIKQARGAYVMMGSADTELAPEMFSTLRKIIKRHAPLWLCPGPELHHGFVVGQRDELIAAGGFDERMEFYGPDDKDLVARLTRRGGRLEYYPYRLLHDRPTPKPQKFEGYRLPLTRDEMSAATRPFFEENTKRETRTANDGIEWGAL